MKKLENLVKLIYITTFNLSIFLEKDYGSDISTGRPKFVGNLQGLSALSFRRSFNAVQSSDLRRNEISCRARLKDDVHLRHRFTLFRVAVLSEANFRALLRSHHSYYDNYSWYVVGLFSTHLFNLVILILYRSYFERSRFKNYHDY